jgi:hypothetical protein
MTPSRSIDWGPWLWGARSDLALFGGSAALALALVVVGRVTGISHEPFPEWAWLVLVLGIDVAHVHSTWFRTYLDRSELARHPWRYALVPLAAYAAGVALYAHGEARFWRVLAYLAVFHFVRQQAGWVAVYRARAGQKALVDRLVDDAAIYAATLYPLLHWHAHPEGRSFGWLVDGDIATLAFLQAFLPLAQALWATLLATFAVRQAWRLLRHRSFDAGKALVISTTAACWYVGIVASRSDYEFTVTNVVIHGVPYLGLLWSYGVAASGERPRTLVARVTQNGVPVFLALVLSFALLEEALWDGFVWHERSWLFGAANSWMLSRALMWVVPLLAVPQATHYLLDGIVWRRSETRARPEQQRALGFPGRALGSSHGSPPR